MGIICMVIGTGVLAVVDILIPSTHSSDRSLSMKLPFQAKLSNKRDLSPPIKYN